jgi:uncharacterized protein involved in outer membrane biogenesis
LKKALIGLFAIIGLAVGAALVAPGFIDWNAYRAEIATEVRKATGRRLTIDGNISVALLPAPQLSVAKVRLANLEGAQAPDMAKLEALDVRIAFWPLLSGKIEVSSVILRGADIELEALADGRVNWDFGAGRKAGAAKAAGAAGDDVAADAVRLEQVVISRGRVTYRDSRNNSIEKVEDIEARLAAETLAGPFVLRGRAKLRGVPLAVEGRTGRFSGAQPASLSGRIEVPGAKAHADITGRIALGDAARVDIKLDAGGENLSALIGTLTQGDGGPAALARKFSLRAAVAADARSVSVNDIDLAVNGARFSGAVSARLGTVTSVDATFAANTLDLDSWLSASATPAKPDAKSAPFSLPRDLKVAFDARIGGVTWRKGAMRNVALQGQLDRGTLSLTRLGAELPGGSEVSASGRLSARDGAPHFDGRFDLTTADARALLDWGGVDHSAIAPDRLHRVSLRAGMGYAPERLELRDIDLRFDSTRIGGGVVVALRERLALGANVSVDQLNLDALLAAPKSAATKPAAKPAAVGGGFTAFDANIRARADALTVKGMALRGVSLDGTLVGGDLAIKSFNIADFAGGKLALSGKIADLDKAPLPDLRFSLSTGAPEKLAALVGLGDGLPAAKLRPFALDGVMRSDAKSTSVDARLAAGALRVGLKGNLADLTTAPRLGLDLKADHPNYVEFLRLFLPDYTPRVAGKGPFSLAARADGAGLDLKLANVAARFGEAEVTGNATFALAAVRSKMTADFKAGVIVADHFIPASVSVAPSETGRRGAGVPPAGAAPWSDAPLDLKALRDFDADVKIEGKRLDWRAWQVVDPRIDITLAGGRFDVRRMSGRTVGGSFAATGSLAAPAKPGEAAELRAEIDVSRADLSKAMFNATELDIAKGTVTFRMNVAGKGASSRTLVSSLGGAGSIEAVDGAVTGFDLGRVNERLKNLDQPTAILSLLQTAMSGGTTKFSRLAGTFKIEKGVLRSTDIALAADGGSGSATVTADLPRWTIDANGLFRLSGHRDAPPFRMALKGPLDQPRRIFNLNELQSWLISRAAGGLLQQMINRKKGTTTAPQAAPQATPQPGQAQPAPQPSQPAPPKPDEFIRGIFDLLQKK